MATKKTQQQAPEPLPAGVREADLVAPAWDKRSKLTEGLDWDSRSFELWHTTGFGWCIPTLLIGRASPRRANTTDRTYAVRLDGSTVRIGKGPHVTRTVTVHVTKPRLADLQKYLDLRLAGQAKAGAVRDRISSRRAQGQEERAAGNSSWRWNR